MTVTDQAIRAKPTAQHRHGGDHAVTPPMLGGAAGMSMTMPQHPYRNLAVQTLISGTVMYLAMFAMIDTLGSFYNNLNYLYMTLMMAAPMVVVMVVAMRGMFPSRTINVIVLGAAVTVFFASYAAIRHQVGIGNAAFLRSMIPHHSGAILMCEQASITDPAIRSLCVNIDASQKQEVATMQAMLRRY